jgi:hypothetical protein
MTIFKALLEYHQMTRRIPACRPLGDEVEDLLVEWDRTYDKKA